MAIDRRTLVVRLGGAALASVALAGCGEPEDDEDGDEDGGAY